MANNQAHMTDLARYDHEDIVDYLKIHVRCWKTTGCTTYDSHFISMTDSFEHAVTWAVRFRRLGDVKIYAVDLWSMARPALSINMAHAMKAWNLQAEMVKWRSEMLSHGGETEWIFLDHVVAKIVTAIDFQPFAHRQPTSTATTLFDVVPQLQHHGRRSILHSRLFFSKEEKKEMERFDNKVWIKSFAPIPYMPKCIRSDQRTLFDHRAANEIWNLVKHMKDGIRSKIFVYIASTMTKTKYYRDSIIPEVAKFFPTVVTSNLHRLHDTSPGSTKELLVWYRPEEGSVKRKDVNELHSLYEALVREWVRTVQEDTPVYIVRGATTLWPKVLALATLGLQGRCKIVQRTTREAPTVAQVSSTCPLSHDEVLQQGELIRKELSSEEIEKNYYANYNGVFHTVVE